LRAPLTHFVAAGEEVILKKHERQDIRVLLCFS
jgi:hypothetical protein